MHYLLTSVKEFRKDLVFCVELTYKLASLRKPQSPVRRVWVAVVVYKTWYRSRQSRSSCLRIANYRCAIGAVNITLNNYLHFKWNVVVLAYLVLTI